MLYWNSDGKYGWNPAVYISELVWGTGASAYLPGLGWGATVHEGEAGWTAELEVRLVDDDGDGVPDRGVIEAPAVAAFDRGFGLGHDWHFGSRHGGRIFSLFRIVGGMALFGLLIGLGVPFLRRRFGPRPS